MWGWGSCLSVLTIDVTSCAFYSYKLFPAELNDDVDNRELLVVKLALVEWRHWL